MKRRQSLTPIEPPAPLVRIKARTGPTAIMGYAWRDPEDDRPSAARTAREIAGHRAYCPLRWNIRRHGTASAITERHVWAADRLRRVFDLAVMGASGPREMVPVLSIVYGPRTGFSAAAMAQPKAHREVRRVMALFSTEDRMLITTVVLFNRAVSFWCQARRERGLPGYPKVEMARLVVCLTLLEQHYAAELDEDVAKGRLLAA
jgi:hypothetical protein